VWTMPRCWTMDYIDLIYKDYSTIINGPLKILDRQAKGGNIPQKALIERSPCLRGVIVL
jgi:hypothetical protein